MLSLGSSLRRLLGRFPRIGKSPHVDTLAPILQSHRISVPMADSSLIRDGMLGTVRFILGVLTDRRIRQQFPHALRDGETGTFCGWFSTSGRFDLSDDEIRSIRKAFASHLGDRCRRVYEVRRDLREAFPFGLTPRQRENYLRWLLEDGRSQLGLRDEEILWYMAELDEDPSAGLEATYLLTSEWQQAVPHALTVFGWETFKQYLAKQHQFNGEWFGDAKKPDHFGPWDELRQLWQAHPELPRYTNHSSLVEWLTTQNVVPCPDDAWFRTLESELASGIAKQHGANVLGFFRYASGVQEAVNANVTCLRRHGSRIARRDIPVDFPCDWRDRERYQDLESFDISIINTGAFEFLDELYRRAGLHARQGVYRIALWSWELESFPVEALVHGELADEIWVPSEFIAQSVRSTGTSKPVVAMLPGIEPPSDSPMSRERFGLHPAKFLFLFMFDMGSVMERKNPLGLIRAFRKAFRPDEPVQLAIKMSRGESRPANRAKLLAAAKDAGITVIDQVMTREQSFGLLAASDCYVSLHRAEGVGFSLAEAMLMGKPTIATGYSGNLDFMSPQTSVLVKCGRVAIDEEIPPYAVGSVWGAPDEDDAARCLRWVHDHPTEAWAMGRRARESARVLLSPIAAGARMVKRLEQIRAERRS